MFYDERIEKAKGRIFKNAILLSVIIFVIFGAILLTNILNNTNQIKYLCRVILEAIIILGGVICLIIGFIRSKAHIKDERTEFEESCFYNKASSILIKIVTIVFAIFLPIVLYINLPSNYADGGFDNIFLVLSFTVGIYVIYEFKRNDIYFNYSIMEDEHYYKRVFKNISKLALYILNLLVASTISFVLVVLIKQPTQAVLIKHIFQIIVVYCGALLEFSLLYLLYSFLEKLSYNSTRWLSKSTTISLGITVFIYAIYTFITIFVNSTTDSQAQAMQTISIVSSMAFCIDFALLIFLTYFGYEYLKIKHNKLLSIACIIILLSKTLSFLLGQFYSEITSMLLREMMENDAYNIKYFLSITKTIIQDASSIANIIGFSLLVCALIKDKMIRKINYIAIICFVVLGGIELFLRTQVDYLKISIYHSIAKIAVLIYLWVLVIYIEKKGIYVKEAKCQYDA